MWEVSSGRELYCLKGHTGRVDIVRFSPDGSRLVSCSQADRTIRIWEPVSGRELRRIEGYSGGRVCMSPDGFSLAEWSNDCAVRMWDLNRGVKLRRLLGHECTVDTLVFRSDGRRLATTSWDVSGRYNAAVLWDAQTGAVLRFLPERNGWILSVGFAPDGRLQVSASNDYVQRQWNDDETGESLERHERSVDLPELVAMPTGNRYQAVRDPLETIVQNTTVGRAVAWFALPLTNLTEYPSGRSWAGSYGSYLCLVTLEGGELPATMQ